MGWALRAGNCSRVVAVGRVEESLPGVVDGVPAKENIWGGLKIWAGGCVNPEHLSRQQ